MANNVVVKSNSFSNIDCYWCNAAMIKVQGVYVEISSSTFTSINNDAYTLNQDPTAALINVRIRLPYSDSGGSTVTENNFIDSIAITGYYSVNPGRVIDFDNDPMVNELNPSSDQITLRSSSFNDIKTTGRGAFSRVNIRTIRMSIESTSFT